MATQSDATRRVRPWVITTPFGTPVVPEVKRRSDVSSGPSAALRRWTSSSEAGVAVARKASHGSSSATTVVRRSGRAAPVAASIAT